MSLMDLESGLRSSSGNFFAWAKSRITASREPRIFVMGYERETQFGIVAQSHPDARPAAATSRLSEYLARHVQPGFPRAGVAPIGRGRLSVQIAFPTTTREAGSGREGLCVIVAIEAVKDRRAEGLIWLLDCVHRELVSSGATGGGGMDQVTAALQLRGRASLNEVGVRLRHSCRWSTLLVAGTASPWSAWVPEPVEHRLVRAAVACHTKARVDQEVTVRVASAVPGIATMCMPWGEHLMAGQPIDYTGDL